MVVAPCRFTHRRQVVEEAALLGFLLARSDESFGAMMCISQSILRSSSPVTESVGEGRNRVGEHGRTAPGGQNARLTDRKELG